MICIFHLFLYSILISHRSSKEKGKNPVIYTQKVLSPPSPPFVPITTQTSSEENEVCINNSQAKHWWPIRRLFRARDRQKGTRSERKRRQTEERNINSNSKSPRNDDDDDEAAESMYRARDGARRGKSISADERVRERAKRRWNVSPAKIYGILL